MHCNRRRMLLHPNPGLGVRRNKWSLCFPPTSPVNHASLSLIASGARIILPLFAFDDLRLGRILLPFLLNWAHNLSLPSQNKTCRYPIAHMSSAHIHRAAWAVSHSAFFSLVPLTKSCLNLPEPERNFLSCSLNDAKMHSSAAGRSLQRTWVIFIPAPAPLTFLQLHCCSSISDKIFENHVCQRDIYAPPGNASSSSPNRSLTKIVASD